MLFNVSIKSFLKHFKPVTTFYKEPITLSFVSQCGTLYNLHSISVYFGILSSHSLFLYCSYGSHIIFDSSIYTYILPNITITFLNNVSIKSYLVHFKSVTAFYKDLVNLSFLSVARCITSIQSQFTLISYLPTVCSLIVLMSPTYSLIHLVTLIYFLLSP